jgi:crotonobetainyl-CoA:carnitine CoA-transferase CaiB-like acyl-CoA transferase
MARLPLEGIRVLDLSMVFAGPHLTKLLAEMGAEVIRIESIQRPDSVRRLSYVENDPADQWWERGAYAIKRGIGKYGITLNLAKPEGAAIFKRMVPLGDVVVEAYSPRVMKNFGLDYPTLKQLNPGIIMVSLSGFGQSGPWVNWVAYGWLLEYISGVTTITGYEDSPPKKIGLSYTDPWAGVYGASAILMALHYRSRTGKGQYIDLAQCDVGTTFISDALMDYVMNGRVWGRTGNRHPSMAPHGCYRCQGNDNWVVVSVGSDEEWERLGKALGNPPWMKDERFANPLGRLENQDELNRLIGEWTIERDHYQVMHTLQEVGVAAGAVLNGKELLFDPHLKERGLFQIVDHPVVGKRPYPRVIPARFSEWPAAGKARKPAPTLGEDNERILVELLGMSKEDLARLEREQVIGTRPLVVPVTPEAAREVARRMVEAQLRVGTIARIEPDYLQQLGLK